ncbi:hypothetical protein RCL_jg17508.t1 [Rhizophagus clarus]|uniref:Uncharacterized protein n=1 Tax=Rhizophagus clarus TaxID=94130 RepID=A0A8H3QEM6_9GLOM|nr:hypothetical protein RCL_jg17508.t1 [Rhizophagus clarus]
MTKLIEKQKRAMNLYLCHSFITLTYFNPSLIKRLIEKQENFDVPTIGRSHTNAHGCQPLDAWRSLKHIYANIIHAMSRWHREEGRPAVVGGSLLCEKNQICTPLFKFVEAGRENEEVFLVLRKRS